MARRGNEIASLERTRDKIKASNLTNRLLLYVQADPQDEDEKKRPKAIMTVHQCNVALALLKKVVPDVAQQQVAVEHTVLDKPVRTLSLEELSREWQETQSLLNGEKESTH